MQKDTYAGNVTVKFRWPILALVLGITAADIIMKYTAVTSLPPEEAAAFPFGLGLHKNPGIAFDIAIPLWIIAPITIVLMIGLGKLIYDAWNRQPKAALAAITIFLGAGSNLFDRLINGFTTDYLILFHTSAINLADVLIILGAIALLSYTKDNPSARTM